LFAKNIFGLSKGTFFLFSVNFIKKVRNKHLKRVLWLFVLFLLFLHPEGIGMENLSAKRVFLSLTQNPKTESEFMTFSLVVFQVPL
jgi:hypothetical protein